MKDEVELQTVVNTESGKTSSPTQPKPPSFIRGFYVENDELTFEVHDEFFRFVAYICFWVILLLCNVLTTATVNPALIANSLIVRIFGSRSLCSAWDYDPPRLVAAGMFPLVDISFLFYNIGSLVRWRVLLDPDACEYKFWIAIAVIKTIIFLEFRMIFNIDPDISVSYLIGHSTPFLLLQIALGVVTIENFVFLVKIKKVPTIFCCNCCENQRCAVIDWPISVMYVVLVVIVTLQRVVYTTSVLVERPIHMNRALQSVVDYTWTIAVAVFPIYWSYRTMKITPPLKIRIPVTFLD